MNNATNQTDIIPALRRLIAADESQRPANVSTLVPFGHAGIDSTLQGGLGRGKLHEIFAGDNDDASSAAGLVSMLALRVAAGGGTIMWLRQEETEKRGGKLYAPGLVDLGLDPARLLLGLMPDPVTLLRVAAEVVCCPEVAVAVIELWRMPRQLDLTASRRLALAAERSGATALMLRIEAEPTPSAAQTRWSVRSAAAAPLEANAPGWPALEVHLLRQRGGPSGLRWQVEWDREKGIFRQAALSGPMVPNAVGGSSEAALRRHAG